MATTKTGFKPSIGEQDENKHNLVRRLSTGGEYSHGFCWYFVLREKTDSYFITRGSHPDLERTSADDSDYQRFFKGEENGEQFKCRAFSRSHKNGAYSLKLVFNDRREGVPAGSHTQYTLILPGGFESSNPDASPDDEMWFHPKHQKDFDRISADPSILIDVAREVFTLDLPPKLEVDEKFNSGKAYYLGHSAETPEAQELDQGNDDGLEGECAMIVGGEVRGFNSPEIEAGKTPKREKEFYEGVIQPEEYHLITDLYSFALEEGVQGLPRDPEKFALFSLSNPLLIRKWENSYLKALRASSKEPRKWIEMAERYVKLHTRIEDARFPRHEEKTPEHYEVVSKPDFLFSGDYLPGLNFELGNPDSWNREKLLINKSDPEVTAFLVESRIAAIRDSSEIKTAQFLNTTVSERFKNGNGDELDERGLTVGVGEYMKKGEGVCRQQALALQLGLQEAGIKSALYRTQLPRGRHLWVEPEIEGEIYVADPTWGAEWIRKSECPEREVLPNNLKIWRRREQNQAGIL